MPLHFTPVCDFSKKREPLQCLGLHLTKWLTEWLIIFWTKIKLLKSTQSLHSESSSQSIDDNYVSNISCFQMKLCDRPHM